MEKLCFYFLLFLSYSFVGYLCEVIACSVSSKKFVLNRGFLLGPWCPIYGFGSLLMLLLLKKYQSDPIALFVMSFVVCTILEYLTSYIMEKLFKARWWDYSKNKFNINGRVCLYASISFGLLGLLLVYIVNPFYSHLLDQLPKVLFYLLSMILVLIFIVDVILSSIVIIKIRRNVVLLEKGDFTQTISRQIREALSHHQFLIQRLLNAFPQATVISNQDLFRKIRKIMDDINKKRDDFKQILKERRKQK